LKAEFSQRIPQCHQKFDGIKTCAGIVDDMRASVRLSAHPLYVSRKDVPGNLIETEREICVFPVAAICDRR